MRWNNAGHIRQLAELWNVEEMTIPHWSEPTHAMQVFRYAEQGSIRLLWISATNPAVSLSDLARIRRILAQEDLFVVVQDLFLTETGRLADVVLPAATWGERTGTFTNTDRTVHISDKAIDPPGEARPDLDIFLDYARRMDFRDKDGAPLISWDDPESAFEAWKACSQGRPCECSGMTYDRLRGRSGIQWPCPDRASEGTERLYTGGRFNTEPDYSETYGHDLGSGAAFSEAEYRAREPRGRAFLHAAHHEPPARGGRRRVPAAPDHRTHRLPVPHPNEDRANASAPGRGARRLGRAQRPGRVRHGGGPGRRRAGRIAAGCGRGASTHLRHPSGRRVRAVPLRRLGPRIRTPVRAAMVSTGPGAPTS